MELLVATFSLICAPESRPSKDCRRANLATLYRGEGGEVIQVDKGEPAAADPPPYTSAAADARPVSNGHDDEPSAGRVLALLEGLNSFSKRIEARFDQMENRLDEMERRFDDIGCCVEQIKDELSGALDDGCRPCRYSTEEREDLVGEVRDQMDSCEMDLKAISKDTLEEVEKDANKAMTEMREELDEKMKEFEETIEEYVKSTLREASVRVQGNFVLDI
ncbi:hypothetical protein Trco_007638 [Trichoderma cornu-damae]|uniref:Uncharacterized protein n=1 Tax=Trichoderma cornu-damae TaxID=654480 RepID=A0A9P8TTL6_9HYPO|nr:hypothetical protein Trco_007638 [Trichoderma cornu-damae]